MPRISAAHNCASNHCSWMPRISAEYNCSGMPRISAAHHCVSKSRSWVLGCTAARDAPGLGGAQLLMDAKDHGGALQHSPKQLVDAQDLDGA